MKRKALSLVAMLLLMASLLSVPAAAASVPTDPGISLCYESLRTITAAINITSSGKAECSGAAKAVPSTNKIAMTMTLQRYIDGYWSDVTSWSTSGTGSVNLDKAYYVTSGYYYHVKVVVIVSTSSGTYVETETVYSSPVYY